MRKEKKMIGAGDLFFFVLLGILICCVVLIEITASILREIKKR